MGHTLRFAMGAALLSLLFFVLCVVLGWGYLSPGEGASPVFSESTGVCVVLDPGHGGEDGGCSSAEGAVEKDLNLSIAEDIAAILNAAGCPAVLTRTEDKLLYDLYGDLADYTGRKKTYDLRNRLRFSEAQNAQYLVSIHMNKFPDPQYNGLQVYYSGAHPESARLAELIQSYAAKYIQPENRRKTKASSKGIYLLERSTAPAVLVECGFLSNPEEAELLSDPEYQKALALTVAAAILEGCAVEGNS